MAAFKAATGAGADGTWPGLPINFGRAFQDGTGHAGFQAPLIHRAPVTHARGSIAAFSANVNMQPAAAPVPAATVQLAGPVFSIDVECVATGTDHNSRDVAQISLVNQFEQVILNLYVRPTKPVVSYLTQLTGLHQELLDTYGSSLEQALATLRQHLPKNAVLVGQNIGQDVSWLGLKEGTDFGSLMDLAGMYRAYNPQYKSFTVFGQDQVAKVLLGWQMPENGTEHNAVTDAIKSVRLFNLYHQLHASGKWEEAQAALLASPPSQSFARRFPSYEGVCMGNRKTCSCGAPFFS